MYHYGQGSRGGWKNLNKESRFSDEFRKKAATFTKLFPARASLRGLGVEYCEGHLVFFGIECMETGRMDDD